MTTWFMDKENSLLLLLMMGLFYFILFVVIELLAKFAILRKPNKICVSSCEYSPLFELYNLIVVAITFVFVFYVSLEISLGHLIFNGFPY